MTAGRALTPAELARLRELYETCPWMTVADIAALAQVVPGSVTRRARRHGWRRAAPLQDMFPAAGADVAPPAAGAAAHLGRAAGCTATQEADDGGPGQAPDRRSLIAALWRAVRMHVADLSAKAGAGEADAARAAQTLMTIARTVEKLIEMERADAAARTGAPCDDGTAAAGPGGADAGRAALAARLEALLRERLARDDLADAACDDLPCVG